MGLGGTPANCQVALDHIAGMALTPWVRLHYMDCTLDIIGLAGNLVKDGFSGQTMVDSYNEITQYCGWNRGWNVYSTEQCVLKGGMFGAMEGQPCRYSVPTFEHGGLLKREEVDTRDSSSIDVVAAQEAPTAVPLPPVIPERDSLAIPKPTPQSRSISPRSPTQLARSKLHPQRRGMPWAPRSFECHFGVPAVKVSNCETLAASLRGKSWNGGILASEDECQMSYQFKSFFASHSLVNGDEVADLMLEGLRFCESPSTIDGTKIAGITYHPGEYMAMNMWLGGFCGVLGVGLGGAGGNCGHGGFN
ncbi:hypothetical protein P154DRAFT_560050 [Amniculicola lignicola CBS 123094]|uniref:Uncharacterized protein n=1 Tax=Amniculicola lignicola CBS 123094 TaxID=1392246 RepID=A0A6A5WTQ3_9PLEO|nr:hypothetical protein P154DRAFT_560050 [Amniculicola lignicola CBS 123094]